MLTDRQVDTQTKARRTLPPQQGSKNLFVVCTI